MSNDFFQHKAGNYEQNKERVTNVDNIANAMLDKITFKEHMQIMDFGSGTGLLLEKIAPKVKKITAVDISTSMNQQLASKKDSLQCDLEIIEMDLSTTELNRTFDGIISSMTLHHIDDTDAIFSKFYSLLNEGSFLAIADLDKEDGNFHSEDTGVFHFGFDQEKLSELASNSGFKNIEITTVSTVHKPQGNYPVFLLTAVK